MHEIVDLLLALQARFSLLTQTRFSLLAQTRFSLLFLVPAYKRS